MLSDDSESEFVPLNQKANRILLALNEVLDQMQQIVAREASAETVGDLRARSDTLSATRQRESIPAPGLSPSAALSPARSIG